MCKLQSGSSGFLFFNSYIFYGNFYIISICDIMCKQWRSSFYQDSYPQIVNDVIKVVFNDHLIQLTGNKFHGNLNHASNVFDWAEHPIQLQYVIDLFDRKCFIIVYCSMSLPFTWRSFFYYFFSAIPNLHDIFIQIAVNIADKRDNLTNSMHINSKYFQYVNG